MGFKLRSGNIKAVKFLGSLCLTRCSEFEVFKALQVLLFHLAKSNVIKTGLVMFMTRSLLGDFPSVTLYIFRLYGLGHTMFVVYGLCGLLPVKLLSGSYLTSSHSAVQILVGIALHIIVKGWQSWECILYTVYNDLTIHRHEYV